MIPITHLLSSKLYLGALIASLFLLTILVSQSAPARGKGEQAASVGSAEIFADAHIEARSAVVLDARNGTVLFEKNPDTQLPLASLTKVALVLAVSEVLPRDLEIIIPADASPDLKLRLGAGTEWRVQDLIDFTLVTSSNGGAELLASLANDELHARYPASPERGAAVWRMNELARELGLRRTYFVNANGLDESATQSGAYGSARDMAKLFTYAYRNAPALFSGTARGDVLLTSEGGARATVENTNAAHGRISGLIMGKTGFTDLAGGNLGVVFDVGIGRPVVAVVLGSSYDGRFSDIRVLAERAWAEVTRE
jgi:D-alanyl-D-alanine carboxypeptidase